MTKTIVVVAAVASLFASISSSQNRLTIDSLNYKLKGFETVSMIQLIANPQLYEGKRVQVSGVMHLKYGDEALYLSKEDGDFLRTANALWIDFVNSPKIQTLLADSTPALGYFDGKKVILRGFFNYNNTGHLNAYAGAIERVDYVFEQRQWYDGATDISYKPRHPLKR